jgi:hypothetical protein
MYHPDLRAIGVADEHAAKAHYIATGRREGRLYRRVRVLLRYTACTGLINQHYSHIAAFSLAAVLGAELVLPPAVCRDSFAHYFRWGAFLLGCGSFFPPWPWPWPSCVSCGVPGPPCRTGGAASASVPAMESSHSRSPVPRQEGDGPCLPTPPPHPTHPTRPTPPHPGSVYKEKNEVKWSPVPLDSLLDVDSVVAYWKARGLVVHRTPALTPFPDLTQPEIAFPEFAQSGVDPALIARCARNAPRGTCLACHRLDRCPALRTTTTQRYPLASLAGHAALRGEHPACRGGRGCPHPVASGPGRAAGWCVNLDQNPGPRLYNKQTLHAPCV